MPPLSATVTWPERPSAHGFDAKRDAVGQKVHFGPLLAQVIGEQYAKSSLVHPHRLEDLADPQSRSVTTGHQLCLAGGPAFTFHKIQTAITLAHRLQERWGTPVVPVFWLASEDHDFEEVSSLWDGTHWQTWSPQVAPGGPVGRMSSEGLTEELKKWGDAAGVERLNHGWPQAPAKQHLVASDAALGACHVWPSSGGGDRRRRTRIQRNLFISHAARGA